MQQQDGNLIRVEGTDRVFHRLKILFVLLLPLAMSLMAVSSVNVALHTIETGLGATASDLQWILSGYALAFGISLVPSGRAGDALGRGSLFVAGLAVFVLGSLASGLAPDPLVLNAARILQGLGAGLFNPQIVGMIQQYFSGGGRAKAFALFGLVISASVAIGPIVAGAIINALGPEVGWRWAFLFNIPLGVAGIVLALAWFPFGAERRRRALRRAGGTAGPGPRARVDLDPVGSVLLALGVLAVMLPFMIRDRPAAWGLLLVAALVLAGWVRWERRYLARGRQPMVDLGLFRYASFRNGTIISGTMFLGVATTFVVVALFLQNGLKVSPLETGLIGLPNALVSAYFSWWSGERVMRHGRRIVVFSLLAMALGSVLSVGVVWLIVNAGVSFWWLAAPLMLNGAGMGAMGSANQTLSLEDVPVRAGGTAGGVKQTVERVATAIGNAAVTGVFFLGHALRGWPTAFGVAFAVITACLLGAAWFAVRDERFHRAAHASAS